MLHAGADMVPFGEGFLAVPSPLSGSSRRRVGFFRKREDPVRYLKTFRSSDFIALPCGVPRLTPVKPTDSVANQFYIGFANAVPSRKCFPLRKSVSRALNNLRDRFIIELGFFAQEPLGGLTRGLCLRQAPSCFAGRRGRKRR